MKATRLTTAASRKRAEKILALIEERDRETKFREQVSAVGKLQELVKDHGIVNAQQIAWIEFGQAIEKSGQKFWKLIIDGLQLAKDRRGL